MVDAILGQVLLWSFEISGIIALSALCCWCFRKKTSNIHSAILNVTVLCIWLIPLSPYLIEPFLQQPFVQSIIAVLESSQNSLFSKGLLSNDPSQRPDFKPTPVKTTGQSSAVVKDQKEPGSSVEYPILTIENQENGSWTQIAICIAQSIRQYIGVLTKVLFGIWVIGVAFFFVRWVHSWWSVSRIVSSSQNLQNRQILELIERVRQLLFIHKKIIAKQTHYPIAPFVKGIRQPILILPVSLLEESSVPDIKAIIAHELAHLRRYDLEVHQLIRFLKILFWFLPPIWWLQAKVYNAQDMASDECAAVVLGSGVEIGEALTHLADYYLQQRNLRWNALYSLTGFMEDKHILLQRLDNITSTPISQLTRIPPSYYFIFLSVSLLVLMSTGLIGLACLSPAATRQDRAPIQPAVSIDPSGSALRFGEESKIHPPSMDKTIAFSPAISFATQTALSTCMDIGDINGDGFADIVYGTDVGEGKSVFINQAGQAIAPGQEFFGKRDKFSSVVLADVDVDGDLDIVPAQYYKQNQVFLNDGKGVFSRGSSFGEANSFSQHVNVGDFNGDGFPDIAQYNRKKSCKVFWNNGRGFFPSETVINRQGTDRACFRTVDYDRDGDLDIAIAPYAENTILLYENKGNGQFAEQYKQLPFDYPPGYIKILTSDLFRGNAYNLNVFLFDRNQGTIFIDRGESTMALQTQFPQTLFPLYNEAKALDTGDVDGDGDSDFVLGNDQQPAQLYLNEGNGQFASPIPIGEGGVHTVAIRFADMDLDGDLDIVTGNSDSPGVVYRNEMAVRVQAVTPLENEILTTNPACITVRFTHAMKPCNSTNFIVNGSQTGMRSGRYRQVDKKTCRFFPGNPFLPGETIWVTLTRETMSSTQERLPRPYMVSFTAAAAPGPARFDSDRRTFGSDYSRARSVALGDLNGDGALDIVTGGDENGSQAYFNDGKGNFGPARPIAQTKEDTLCVAVCDIDGDGDMDVLAGNSDRYPNKIYLNDGNGAFPEAVEFLGSHGNTNALAAGDMNGDGRIDSIFANNIASECDHRIYLNKGNNTFREFSRLGSGLISIQAFALADLDGDRAPDLMTLGWGGSNYYFPNDGSGNFRNDLRWLCSANGATLCVGDFDSDRDIDLICQRHFERNEPLYADLFFLRNRGKGEFDSNRLLELGGKENDLQAGDIDGDGDLDLLLSSARQGPELILFRNSGSGEFNREVLLEPASLYPPRIALGDLDGDGRLDIVTAKYGGLNSIYYNRDSFMKMADNRE